MDRLPIHREDDQGRRQRWRRLFRGTAGLALAEPPAPDRESR